MATCVELPVVVAVAGICCPVVAAKCPAPAATLGVDLDFFFFLGLGYEVFGQRSCFENQAWEDW